MGRRETDKIFTIGSKKLEKESKKMSISVQGISKNFKGRRKGESDNQVLKDVSFEIEVRMPVGTVWLWQDNNTYNCCRIPETDRRNY